MAEDMNDAIFKSKKALPNKLLQEDGSITDLLGNPITDSVDAYNNKPALPNKWLNADGTYTTLSEIIAGAIDTELFIIVEELPASGETNKIYLLIKNDKLVEYHWTGSKWDPIGMVEFDVSQYSTTDEMNAAIATALQSAKTYAENKANDAEQNAKAYTDTEISKIDLAGTLQSAEEYADSVGTSAVSSANGYTDTQIQQKITQVLGGSY